MDTTTYKNGMMESIALSELHVVIDDESDYVFVRDDGLLESDDESYDRCDFSPDLSCATSVATEVTLRDLNLSLIDEGAEGVVGVESSMFSLDEERDDSNSTQVNVDVNVVLEEEKDEQRESDKRAREPNRSCIIEHRIVEMPPIPPKTSNSNSNNNYNTSRLSNKKRRKKIKTMKKAAAAAAAAALAEANKIAPNHPLQPTTIQQIHQATAIGSNNNSNNNNISEHISELISDHISERSTHRRSSSRSKGGGSVTPKSMRKSRVHHLASIASYREETSTIGNHIGKQKKKGLVNYVSLL